MKSQTTTPWTTAFHLEWIVLFMILLLGWFVVSPDNLWATPMTAIYALLVAAVTYVVVRVLHHGTPKWR